MVNGFQPFVAKNYYKIHMASENYSATYKLRFFFSQVLYKNILIQEKYILNRVLKVIRLQNVYGENSHVGTRKCYLMNIDAWTWG